MSINTKVTRLTDVLIGDAINVLQHHVVSCRGSVTLIGILGVLAILVAIPSTAFGQAPLNITWRQQSQLPNNDVVLDVDSDMPGNVYGVGVIQSGDPATGITEAFVQSPDGQGGIYIGGGASTDAAGSLDGVLLRSAGSLQSLHVETPNTRTRWGIGTVQRIAWWHEGAEGEFEIEVSRGDDSWETIAIVPNRAGTSQSFYWTVTGPSTNSANIRVTATAGGATDTNDVQISIAEAFISVLRPVQNQEVEVGDILRIFFEHNLGARAPIAIDVTDDEGASWQSITESASTTGSTTSSFAWKVDLASATPLRLRIRALDGSGPSGVSDAFTVLASARYGVVHLGTLGGDYSAVAAINDHGQVVGTSRTTGGLSEHAFSWTRAGGMIDLGAPGDAVSVATGVNNKGHVTGRIIFDEYVFDAFYWTPSGGMLDLGTFGGSRSQPNDINDENQVVGWSFVDGDAAMRGFSWTPASGMVDLKTLGGTNSGAAAVNEHGEIVGWSFMPGDRLTHAVLWTPSGRMIDLGTLDGEQSGATDVNDSGQVVGSIYWDSTRTYHAFSWTAEGGMVDLGTLGGASSQATAVNNRGQVLGWSNDAGGIIHPFVWTESDGMIDLGSLLGSVTTAGAISDKGEVVGGSSPPGVGAPHAFSWSKTEGTQDLGPGAAIVVNNSGWIAGEQYTAGIPGANATVWIPQALNPTHKPRVVSTSSGSGPDRR
jgi:probable HAF family extracellular repeat protein